MTTPLNGLAKRLVDAQAISLIDCQHLLSCALDKQCTLVQVLLSEGSLCPYALAAHIADEYALPLFDVDSLCLDALPFSGSVQGLFQRHQALPLRQQRQRLSLAVADPSDQNALNELRFHSGCQLDLIIAALPAIQQAFQRLDQRPVADRHEVDTLGQLADDALQVSEPRPATSGEAATQVDEAPVVRFVHQLLCEAAQRGASDIHLEPFENTFRVRYRLDGLLTEVIKPPPRIAGHVSARLKVLAGLDIAERRLPQDGRLRLSLSRSRTMDCRINTLPTLWGEKIVLRLLDNGHQQLALDRLGLETAQQEQFLAALNQSQGLILVTGPTGSGKTVTLYAGLNYLNRVERNIATAEDPVEIHLDGINQVAVNQRSGLNFATALRAFLRQDPDVLMIGEIRDHETADMAVKAAQTGHLVLSTLHTSSAAETLTRLLTMGIPAYNLASSLSLLMAQRLARRLCDHCKQALSLPESVLLAAGFNTATLPQDALFGPTGCRHCHQGYRGRIGLYEVLPVSTTLSRAIIAGQDSFQIAETARQEGFIPLREAALRKVSQGIISLDEALRVT